MDPSHSLRDASSLLDHGGALPQADLERYGIRPFDKLAIMWEYPTMSTTKVDAKKRIVLPSGRPGDIYDVQRQDEGCLLLVRLEQPEQPKRMSKEVCLEAMRKAPLRFRMKWEQLRQLTREQ